MKGALRRFQPWGRAAVLTLGLASLAHGAAAHSEGKGSGKPAWKWTAEERAAKRFDPAEMKIRAEAEERRMRQLVAAGMISAEALPKRAPGVQIDSFDGRENPELFMPWELFHSLLTSGFPPDGRHQKEFRQDIEERAAALGFGADLWRRLGKLASPLLELQREDARRAASSKSPNGDSRLTLPICRARARALAAARKEFGEEAFLRLLYEVIAPSLSKSSGEIDPKVAAENVLRIEGGCR